MTRKKLGREADEAEVYTSLTSGTEVLAGTIYIGQGTSSFRYAPEYLSNKNSFDLAPSLPRALNSFYFNGLGPFSDCAPDRWGRKVLARNVHRNHLRESEYLFGVNDVTRQGATRFMVSGEMVAGDEGVPILSNLPDILDAADAIQQDREVDRIAIRRLYAASGSLGGARPKASVLDQGELWLAKFPKPDGDDWDVMGWEALMLDIAQSCAIEVPHHKVQMIHDRLNNPRTVLLLKRFDRVGSGLQTRRIPYISAMTALESSDGDGGDWLDFAEFSRSAGADTSQLWKRAVFGAAIGNLDDHLRNHGFLRQGNAWHLSPAFDMNPEPFDVNTSDNHQLSLFGDTQVTPEMLLGDEALQLFNVDLKTAEAWIATLRSAMSQVMKRAISRGLDSKSVEMMRSRFAHAFDVLS